MKDNKNNIPPEGHQPPPPPPQPEDHKHKHKHEKHHRRGPRPGTVILLLLVIAVAAVVVLWQNGLIHIGKEAGQGAGEGGTSVVSSAPESTASEVSTVVEIKIDKEKIFLDGKEVANAEELKNKITEIGNKKNYVLVHETAIKATYDDVKSVLTELERALSIKVDYNDDSGN